MPLLDITDSTATFGTTIPLSQFADLLAAHRAQYDKTLDVEAQGAALLAADFPAQGSAEFVRAVCNWGGYSGIGGRVLKRNDEAVISDCLRRAAGYLSEARPNISEALLSVSALKGLGSISFASKHLRFLRPDLCPVFDSFLREALPYAFDASGYEQFAQDCARLARQLSARGPKLENRPHGAWYAADVEAAIFAYVADLGSGRSVAST